MKNNDKNDSLEAIKERLRESLLISGGSISELSKFANVTYRGVKQWFDTRKVANHRFKVIAEYLKCEPVWLATGHGSMRSKDSDINPDEFLISCTLMVERLTRGKNITKKELQDKIIEIYKDGFKTKSINNELLDDLIY